MIEKMIEKMFVVSTGHITVETAQALELWGVNQGISDPNERPDEHPEWCDQIVIYPHGDYGWLFCLAGRNTDMNIDFRENAPPELLDCIIEADDNGCDWLLLDRDAEQHPQLKFWEW